MKTRFSLRVIAPFAAALALCTVSSQAHPAGVKQDNAAENLARNGTLPIVQAGRFVAPGTFRVQVSAKLGRPDATLADGTWLYHHRRIEGSDAAGTLVVRFEQGRVSSLALVTPAVATAMRSNPPKTPAAAQFAATQ